MTDENTLHTDISRAARAERLLSDELLLEAFDGLEAAYIKAWKETGARDTDPRERLWQAYQIVGKVKSHLQAIVSNGTMAQRELDEIEKMGERRKVMGIF